MAMFSPPAVPAAPLADRLNRSTAASYDVVVCTTAWAAASYTSSACRTWSRSPFGVDLACFHPGYQGRGPAFPARPRRPDPAGALRPAVAGKAAAARRGRPGRAAPPRRARGAGDRGRRPAARGTAVPGPRPARPVPAARLRPRAAGPAARHRRRGDRARAGGDVRASRRWRRWPAGPPSWSAAGAPCRRSSGRPAWPPRTTTPACADAVQRVLERDVTGRRRLARQRAGQFDWPAAVRGFLDAHGLAAGPAPRPVTVPAGAGARGPGRNPR